MPEVLRDTFSNHNTLAFHDRRLRILQRRYGRTLHWCNRSWRNEHRGWRGLRPVRFDPKDPFCQDVLACLKEDPVDIEHQTRDSMIHTGNMVLASVPLRLKQKIDRERVLRASHKLTQIQDGQPVPLAEEIRTAKVSRSTQPMRSSLSHTRGQYGPDVLRGISSQAARPTRVVTRSSVFIPDLNSRVSSRGRRGR